MEETPEIVQEILNNKTQIKVYAEATDEEVLAYVSAMSPDVVAEATKMIVLAKQGKMIEALSARAAESSDESVTESADTSSVVEDSELSNG